MNHVRHPRRNAHHAPCTPPVVASHNRLARLRAAEDGGKTDPSRASCEARGKGSSPLQKKE